MAKLKKSNNSSSSDKELNILCFKRKLEEVEAGIESFQKQREDLLCQILNIEISPFKIGENVMCIVPMGKQKCDSKCVLECENGVLYVRPYNKDGKLSGRHFSIIPFGDQTYSDFIRKVEE